MARKIIPTAPQAVADAAEAYRVALEVFDAAEAAKVAAAAALLQAMQAAALTSARAEAGTVSVIPGRTSIKIVDDALEAEIEAKKARIAAIIVAAVKKGKAKESQGSPYVKMNR
jgi:hypothetical protein